MIYRIIGSALRYLSQFLPNIFRGEVMARLLREIKHHNRGAADVLEHAGLRSDSDIQTLTREDLHELFPGRENFRLRRTIFDIIHKQKPVDQLLKQLFPCESLRAANNSDRVDYLNMLKDLKTQINNVLDAHISLVEESSTNQPDQESAIDGPKGEPESLNASGARDLHTGPPGGHPEGPQSAGTTDTNGDYVVVDSPSSGHPQSTSTASDEPMESYNDQTGGRPQGTPDSLPARGTSGASSQMALHTGQKGGAPKEPQTKLKYRVVVSGKTFDAHLSLMKKVKDHFQNELVESNQDHQITFLFCPISSRVASDVEAAMADATVSSDDKPIILVLMHHTREVKSTSSMRTWRDDTKVVLFVHVFYHETICGLLKCDQNNAAVAEIRKELLERFFPERHEWKYPGRGSWNWS